MGTAGMSQLFSGVFPRRDSLLAQPQVTQNRFGLRFVPALGSSGSLQGGGAQSITSASGWGAGGLWGTLVTLPQVPWLLNSPLPAQHLPEDPSPARSSLSSEVGASSHPSSRTPSGAKFTQIPSKPAQSSRAPLSRRAERDGVGSDTPSSGATKHPPELKTQSTSQKNRAKREPKCETHQSSPQLRALRAAGVLSPLCELHSHISATSSPRTLSPRAVASNPDPTMGHCCLHPHPKNTKGQRTQPQPSSSGRTRHDLQIYTHTCPSIHPFSKHFMKCALSLSESSNSLLRQSIPD